MNNRTWKIYYLLSAAGLLSGLIHLKYATGFLLGTIISGLMYKRDEKYWNKVVDVGVVGKGTGLPHFLGNYAIMAVLLLCGAWFPQYINIFAAALGLTTVKIALIVEVLTQRKE